MSLKDNETNRWRGKNPNTGNFNSSWWNGDPYLVVMTRTLAVFSQRLEGLVDETNIDVIDVESQQTESTGCTAADAVEKLEGLAYQVVVGLVVLWPEEMLQRESPHSIALVETPAKLHDCMKSYSGLKRV